MPNQFGIDPMPIQQVHQAMAAAVHVPNIQNQPEQPMSDFSSKYKDTYVVAVSSKAEEDVFYVGEVHPTEDDAKSKKFKITLYDSTGDGILVDSTDLKIISTIPSSKFVNEGYYAVYYNRFAERQWKRGLCRQTMGSRPIGTDLIAVEGAYKAESKVFNRKLPYKYQATQGFNRAVAVSLFKPVYAPYPIVVENLRNNKFISSAFHASYCLALSAAHSGFDLYRETSILGRVSINDPTNIKLNSKLFYQEIIDLFRRIAQPAQISVE